jgi:hypothetical protein
LVIRRFMAITAFTLILALAFQNCGDLLSGPKKKNSSSQLHDQVAPDSAITAGYMDEGWDSPYADGWYPKISPDGRYVSFGNVERRVLDLVTKEVRQFQPNAYGGFWITNENLVFLAENGGNNTTIYQVTRGVWNPVAITSSSQDSSGPDWGASDGHWINNINGNVRVDGRIIKTGIPFGTRMSRGRIVYATDPSGANLGVMDLNGNTLRTHPCYTPQHERLIFEDHVVYGAHGPIHGIYPNGTDIEVTLDAPSGYNRDEGVGAMFKVNQQIWHITNTSYDRGYVLIRPFGSRSAIIYEGDAVSVDAIAVQDKIIFAFADATGRLHVRAVPINSPRATFQ